MVNHNSKEIVYLITGGEFYKIGRSTEDAFRGRLASIQCGNPRKIKIVKFVSVNDSTWVEGELHKRFSENRVRGEWFLFDSTKISSLVNYMDELSSISVCQEKEPKVLQEELERRWRRSIKILISTCEENEYNPNWVFYRLEKLKPTKETWETYAAWRGYKTGWASIQFAKQDEVVVPPNITKHLLGLSSTRVSRERQLERNRRKNSNRTKIK